MRKETKNWLEMADYDLKTAEYMMKTERYVYVIFMCHLAVEKALKAIVAEEVGKVPPKTHDLIYLTKQGKVSFSPKMLDYIGQLNNASVATRYPEDLSTLISVYSKEVARDYLNQTKEVVKWLRKDTRLV